MIVPRRKREESIFSWKGVRLQGSDMTIKMLSAVLATMLLSSALSASSYYPAPTALLKRRRFWCMHRRIEKRTVLGRTGNYRLRKWHLEIGAVNTNGDCKRCWCTNSGFCCKPIGMC